MHQWNHHYVSFVHLWCILNNGGFRRRGGFCLYQDHLAIKLRKAKNFWYCSTFLSIVRSTKNHQKPRRIVVPQFLDNHQPNSKMIKAIVKTAAPAKAAIVQIAKQIHEAVVLTIL